MQPTRLRRYPLERPLSHRKTQREFGEEEYIFRSLLQGDGYDHQPFDQSSSLSRLIP